MVSRKLKRKVTEEMRNVCKSVYRERLDRYPYGEELVFGTDRKHHLPIIGMMDDWYVLTQEALDRIGKYAHRIVEDNLPVASSNLGEYGSSRPIFIPKEVLAMVMAEKVIRSKKGRKVVQRTIDNIIRSEELAQSFKEGLELRVRGDFLGRAGQLAEESLSG